MMAQGSTFSPEDFITVVILVSYMAIPDWDSEENQYLDVVEFFAGVARIAKMAAWCGLRARAFDITYAPVNAGERKRGKLRRSPMDLNGGAGLA